MPFTQRTTNAHFSYNIVVAVSFFTEFFVNCVKFIHRIRKLRKYKQTHPPRIVKQISDRK